MRRETRETREMTRMTAEGEASGTRGVRSRLCVLAAAVLVTTAGGVPALAQSAPPGFLEEFEGQFGASAS